MNSETGNRIEVIFIDDEEDFLELADRFFDKKENKINLTVTSSAQDGLEMIEEKNFDAVVSDYKMPGMSGLELLQKLRADGDDIPFIILTGKGKEEVAMEALNKGADRYHIKTGNPTKQFQDLTQSIVEEVIRKKSETELKTFQKWIKNTLKQKPK